MWTTSDLSGAALSLPPGAWRVPLHATLMEGRAFGVNLCRAARLGATIEWRHRRNVRGPHYYVRDVGVLPQMQGKGLGSALLRPTLERCDREGLPAYLEASSERSAALYERLGFQLTDELRVGGSPPLRLMLRPPTRRRRCHEHSRIPALGCPTAKDFERLAKASFQELERKFLSVIDRQRARGNTVSLGG